jgi:hypothetical protein
LIAFRQIHKVLGMDPLPPPKFTRGRFNRKRRRDNSSGEGNDSEGICNSTYIEQGLMQGWGSHGGVAEGTSCGISCHFDVRLPVMVKRFHWNIGNYQLTWHDIPEHLNL